MSTKSFFKLLASLIITFGLTATCILAAYVCTNGGSFMGFEFASDGKQTHVNVMLLGLDKGGTRTDVLILAQLNFVDGEVNMLQIPRDTYIANNGRSDKKINSAYGYKQEKTVFKEVNQLTGLRVDKYVVIDISGFRNLVDTMGGVEFDVPQDMDYEDPEQDLYIHLKKGPQRLDGNMAEQLVRFREGYKNSDLDRLKVQSAFIQATIDELLSASNVLKMNGIITDVSEMVNTNLSLNEMLSYAPHVLAMERSKIQTHALACKHQVIDGLSYVAPDYAENKKIINDHFTPSVAGSVKTREYLLTNVIGENNDNYKSVEGTNPENRFFNFFTSVDVLDASDGEVDSTELVNKIKSYGYNVRTYDKADAMFDETLVVSSSESSSASSIAKLAGMEKYLVNKNKLSGCDVTIIIGKDFNK